MKSISLVVLLVGAVLLGSASPTALATDRSGSAAQWEYAVVKWDGPDRIYYNLPGRFELVYLGKIGVTIPKEAQREEFCLAWAANKMAAEGWEPVNLHSRRILMRRLKAE
jgi:hypothetical protein